jgi:aminoglycoside/choline kinase family phosphotransferase
VADVNSQPAVDARVHAYLRETGIGGRDPRVVPLTGDASDRRYFRVLIPEGESIVLALHTGPIDFATLPFANVASLLEAMPLPVPKILGHSNEHGILALEDLGDVTLQAQLGAATEAQHRALYRESVALIETLQRRGAELESARYLPYTIAFDADKLTWELNFFVKHFLEGYRGISLSPEQHATLAEEWAAIAGELASEPRVVCHRDYHSRNLMVRDGRLYIIDFQDARMGPDTYDLVSLLRDAYVDFSDVELDELIAYFLALKKSAAPDFRRRFDLMSIQRNLKALGTFGFQTASRGNAVYIQYIPRTLRHVKTNLARYPRFDRLRRLLAAHVDEL